MSAVIGSPDLAGDERWARLAWTHLAEPGNLEVHEWLSRHGAAGALDRLITGRLGKEGTFAARLERLDLQQAVRNLRTCGVRLLVPGDEDWPTGLDDLAVPPYGLFVRGSLAVDEAAAGSVAVVGSRAATSYGCNVAAELASGLTARGVTVVSGAAFGIDAAAHRGVLADEGVTIAVLACGLDRAYPAAHSGLLQRIAESGLVLSEIPLGGAPFRTRFLARNRIIATLSAGTVVVEASLRSGSLNTARWARDHNRHVAAVPGPVTAMTSAGCHVEIRERGATLVTDAAEVMDLMGRLGLDCAPPRRAEDTALDELSPGQRAVWSALPVRTGMSVNELIRVCGEPANVVLSGLGRLELAGLVERHRGGWRKRTGRAAAGSSG